MKKYDIIIIGAGASGLMCAAKLSELNLNKKILLIDHMEKIGKKILATGNGKCNISNKKINQKHYHSQNSKFIDIALENIHKTNILNYFDQLGLKTKLIDDGYYPVTEQAISVVDILRLKIEESNIDILLKTEVKNIHKKVNYQIETNNALLETEILVVATGGCSSPVHGSNGTGYQLLNNLNHPITDIYKALVQLKSDKPELKYLKGLRMKGLAKIFVNDKFIKEEAGEIQFTEYGLSGICIFNLSHIASYNKEVKNNQVSIKLDLMPDYTYKELKHELLERKNKYLNRLIDYYLIGLVNNKLSYSLYKELKIDFNQAIATLKEKDIEAICQSLKSYEFNITSLNDFSHAQVTAGGINTNDINPYTYESLIHKKLFIIGEILDINGDCGGYNLTFAFTSGFIAAKTIGEYYDKNK